MPAFGTSDSGSATCHSMGPQLPGVPLEMEITFWTMTPRPPTCYPTSWHTWPVELAQMTPVPSELLHQPVQLVQLHPTLQHIPHPDPTPDLQFARQKRKGLTLALHPAPTPRRPNPSPLSPQMVKMVMTVTQHPKRAMSLKKKMRQTPMAESQMTVKAQTVAALMGKVLAVAAKFQTLMARTKTLMGKLMNPAVRLKMMMKLQPKQPHLKEDPRKQSQHLPDAFTAQLGQQGF